jgi:acyl carrier protein
VDALTKIQHIIEGTLGVGAGTVTAETRATDIREWDSLRHFVLVMELEEAFGCKFALAEVAEMDSVPKVLAAVQKRIPA